MTDIASHPPLSASSVVASSSVQPPSPQRTGPNRVVAVSTRVGRKVAEIFAFVAVGLGVWHLACTVFSIDPLVVPKPLPVLEAMWGQLQSPVTYSAIWVTFQEAILGFLLGAVVGIFLAIVLSEWDLAHKLLNPYIVAFQAIPKVALIPLFIVWFGFGIGSKVLLIATFVFFPIMINMYSGLRNITPEEKEFMSVSHASRWQTFRYLKLYKSMPYLFAAFEASFVLCLTGAVFAELLGSGTTVGLGTLVQLYTARLDMPGLFSIITLLAIFGVLLDVIVKVLAKLCMSWNTNA